MRSAVLFLVFNRPEPTARVFAAIRAARPPRLYVAADGARVGRAGEAERCEATRRIATAVDWPCEVCHLFREENLGCKQAVSQAIDWFFSHEEEGIVLEDDCLPHATFFEFCEHMLERYRDDDRIALVSGDNFQFGRTYGKSSYYFSRYAHIWGWASWRRFWQHYDRNLSVWPEYRDTGGLLRVSGLSATEARHWVGNLDAVAAGRIDTWDFQLQFAMWYRSMVSILPQCNLIQNIGFGEGATHTTAGSKFANLSVQALEFPLIHPESVTTCALADQCTFEQMFHRSLSRRAFDRLRRAAGRLRVF
jgi:hypothetical protein